MVERLPTGPKPKYRYRPLWVIAATLLFVAALGPGGCDETDGSDPRPSTTAEGVSTPTFVQQNSATPQASQSAVQVSFPGAQTAGNLNVVVVGWNDTTATVASVTDSKGNAYARAVGPITLSGALSQSIYYAKNIAAASANTNAVNVAFSPAAAYPDVRILEYSGLDASSPVDVTAQASGTGTVANSGSATTTNANDLLFAAETTTGTTTGPGSGFTSRVITSPDGDIAEDKIVTSTGNYSASATLSGAAGWVMQMVAFKAANQAPAQTLKIG